jgi:hypothetical protein
MRYKTAGKHAYSLGVHLCSLPLMLHELCTKLQVKD